MTRKAIGIRQAAQKTAIKKFPRLDTVAADIADQTARLINERMNRGDGLLSDHPYAAQYVLEMVIRDLERRV